MSLRTVRLAIHFLNLNDATTRLYSRRRTAWQLGFQAALSRCMATLFPAAAAAAAAVAAAAETRWNSSMMRRRRYVSLEARRLRRRAALGPVIASLHIEATIITSIPPLVRRLVLLCLMINHPVAGDSGDISYRPVTNITYRRTRTGWLPVRSLAASTGYEKNEKHQPQRYEHRRLAGH